MYPLFDNEVCAMSISPDGKTLAVGDDAGEIAVWNIAGEKVVQRLRKHTQGVRSLQFSADGGVLISGAYDGLICFWSTETGELLRSVKTVGKIEDVCRSPDGHLLAVSFDEGSEVHIFNADTGKEIVRLKLPFNEPLKGSSARNVVTFSPDGTLLAASSGGRGWPKFIGGDSIISLWNVADWTMRASFTGARFTIYDLEVSPDGKWLAGATNRGKTVKLWGIPAPAVKAERDADVIARLIKNLDSDDFGKRETAQRELAKIGLAAEEALHKAAQSDSAEMRFRAEAILKKLKHGDIKPQHELPGSPFDVHAIAFSPDGKWLASGRQFDKPGNVILYELGDFPRRIVAPHQHGAWTVEFSPDGKQLITGRRDGQITFWNIQTTD